MSSSSTPFTICLWMNDTAEEAAKHYTSIFKDSRIIETTHYPGAGEEVHGHKAGSVMTVVIELNGQRFMLLNGGPNFKPSEAVSLMVMCKDQEEIDYYWDKLGEGGDPSNRACGWTKDKYGFSWQITPQKMGDVWTKGDKEAVNRSMDAMMGMQKLDMEGLQKAYDGK